MKIRKKYFFLLRFAIIMESGVSQLCRYKASLLYGNKKE